MNHALHGAYRRTDYEAAGAIARIGERSAGVDALLASLDAPEGAFVTAWNPMSRPMPWGWNDRMGQRLREAARRLRHAEGWGRAQGGGWAEQPLFIAADARRIAVLARRFRQNAIMVVRRGQPGRLVVLRRATGSAT